MTVLHVFGVAGYRLGWLWAGVPLAGAVVVARRLLGAQFPGRTMWVVALAVAAAVGLGWLVDHAPLSKTRLASELDQLEPAFLTRRTERTSGHSWCRPTCPRVVRTYTAPSIGNFGVLLNVAAEARLEGLMPNLVPVGENRPTRFLRIRGERYLFEATVTRQEDRTTLTMSVTATRGRVKLRAPQMAATTTD